MLPSEVLTARALALAPSPREIRQLPLYVDPLPEEALISWLLRLAARFGISQQMLEQEALGIDGRGCGMQWWRRPHISVLKRISDATGVRSERLRQMTLHNWRVHEDDEESDRFNERRFAGWKPDCRTFRYAACEQCLKADRIPYARLIWTIGWVAICPKHRTVMTTACVHCRSKLHLPRLASPVAFSPVVCSRCQDAVQFNDFQADPKVMRLQGILLRAKRYGTTALHGSSWQETVDRWNTLASTFRRSRPLDERRRLYEQFKHDIQAHWFQAPSARYADLAFLGWLIGLWPRSSGAQIGRELLAARRRSIRKGHRPVALSPAPYGAEHGYTGWDLEVGSNVFPAGGDSLKYPARDQGSPQIRPPVHEPGTQSREP